MKTLSFMLIAAVLFTACSKTDLSKPQSQSNLSASAVSDGSANGRAGVRQVYYDATLFNLNLKEFSANAAATIIANNTQTNNIYVYADLDFSQPFNSVIDAIPADGMNPLWMEVLITFNSGFTPHQFYSDDEVLGAQTSGEITLTTDGDMYRCSVIGPK